MENGVGTGEGLAEPVPCRPLDAAGAPSLDTLTAEFDQLLARLQTDEARERIRTAFGASSAELGRSALEAARSTG